MTTVRLSEISSVRNGFAFKSELFCDKTAGKPLVRIRDIKAMDTEVNYLGRFRDEYLVQTGDMLIGMDGDFECRKWQGGEALLNQRVCRLHTFSPRVIPDYLYFSIQSKLTEIHSKTAFVTVKHISSKQIENIEIALPPLAEQQRIVDILDRAAAIQRLRRAAEEKAREIVPALFVDMFGDPATNPKGWPVSSVGDVMDRIETGKNVMAGAGRSRFRILKVSAVTSGIYDEQESKPAPDDFEPDRRSIVKMGDLLFSRANTAELVGATTMVDRTDGCTLLPDKLWRLVWKENVEAVFMLNVLQNGSIRAAISREASGTSASMRNVSQGKLLGIRFPLPPIELQRTFTQRFSALVGASKLSASASQHVDAIQRAVTSSLLNAA